MATSFPGGLDSFTNPSATDAMDSVTVPHADQHANLNDAVEALQAKVGADSSAVTSSLDYKVANQGLVLLKTINITNYTGWQPVTGCWSSTFKNYRIAITGGTTVGGFATLMKVTGAGSNHYSTTFYHTTGTTTSGTAAINASTYCEVGGSGGTIFDLINVGDANEYIYYASVSNDYTYFRSMGGKVLYAAIPTEIQFAYQGGTFLNATIEVYGYNKG